MRGRPGWKLLSETGWDLVVASLLLRVRPFEEVMRRLDSHLGGSDINAADARIVARALKAWERRLPWRTQCFEQGLAAYRYLRRRNLSATLHYGARGSGTALEAHVWVTSGNAPIVGCKNAADFRELARFPTDWEAS